MIALGLLAVIPALMWIVQTIVLAAHGHAIRWRIDSRGAPPGVRTAGRWTTQLCLLGTIVAYPLIIGRSPTAYYAALLPPTRSALQFPFGAAASALFLCVLFAAWLATGRLVIDIHHARRKWTRRLTLLVPTALFGAFVEELLFRAVVMADLLRSPALSPFGAVIIGAAVFAAAHYVRSVKRHWTLPGHVMLGVLLGIAFLRTGQLWLPAGLHAGGIMMIMAARPFTRYRGPAWLTGASIFPFAGLVGIAGLGIMTLFVAKYFGAPVAWH